MEKVETQEDIQKNKYDFKKKIIIGIGIISSILMLVVSTTIDNFPIFKILIGLLIVIGLSYLFIYFSSQSKKIKDLDNKIKEESKLPDSKSLNDIRVIIKNIVESPERYSNHIRNWGHMISRDVGGNLIYAFELELEYKDKNFPSGMFVVVNSHFPDKIISFIELESSIFKRNYLINNSSTKPREDPVRKIIEEENPLLGTKRRTIETTPNKKVVDVKKENDLG